MTKKLLAILSLLVLVALPASAAEKKGIELKSTAEIDIIVKNDKGEQETVRVSAADTNVTPGDTIIFTTHYEYQGDKPATNVVINNPLPEHMLYLDNTAEGKGARIDFSVDKGQIFAAADKLKIKDAEGKEQPASAADYTHIRWTFEGALQDGAKGSVSYKAKVK
ncbi:MAG: hypothetical protein CVU69_03835 [Deltaproteobacteria bacterium HGW-Deltaproteobacteria-4]|nr:MAG: hypothetical protein CVU69_03835 [Deltaproteobacteria bacterium HGW-Deltaproteobacteria-4]